MKYFVDMNRIFYTFLPNIPKYEEVEDWAERRDITIDVLPPGHYQNKRFSFSCEYEALLFVLTYPHTSLGCLDA